GLLLPACALPIRDQKPLTYVQLGPRPFYLVDDMAPSALKTKLEECSDIPHKPSDFCMSHRGAPLQFPEHSEQGWRAAARMGAGIVECDASFTQDRELVCRHSMCDLHSTTDILTKPELAKKCRKQFEPADPKTGKEASAECCTSDITLEEFKTLCGKMDAFNTSATNVHDSQGLPPSWRTDLYAHCGTVHSHKEFLEIVTGLGLKYTTELKKPMVPMPFQGNFTQEQYAQKLIDEYKQANISPHEVFLQSFELEDILYWLRYEPDFGNQAMYLIDAFPFLEVAEAATRNLTALKEKGVKTIAPATSSLLSLNTHHRGDKDYQPIVASRFAKVAKKLGFDIVAYSIERTGPLSEANELPDDTYVKSIKKALKRDGDVYLMIDALAQDVGVEKVFSDWPATVTYYANCMGI
ncbi:hypothetical protein KEM54_001997, partial [Ascosphaera aggregata]